MTFDHDLLRLVISVRIARTTSFVELVRIAGLDPASGFDGFDLRDWDFGDDDLSGFDFSGADLTGADLSRARGKEHAIFAGTVTSATTRELPPPKGFDPKAAANMIRAAETLPRTWRPFITALDVSRRYSGEDGKIGVEHLRPEEGLTWVPLNEPTVSDLTPLADLTALRSLILRNTHVSDLTPLAGLTALQHLDLSFYCMNALPYLDPSGVNLTLDTGAAAYRDCFAALAMTL